MANQQLIDYVKGQMMAGVSESDIRKILKDAGWPDADIEEGVKGAKPASPVSTTTSAFGSFTSQAAKPAELAKTEVKAEPKKEAMSFDFMSNPAGMSTAGPAASAAKDAGKSAVAQDIMGSGSPRSSGGRLPWIIAGVAVLALVGSIVYFMSNAGKLSGTSDQLIAANAALTAQLAELQGTGATSATELDAAKMAIKDLTDQLTLFVIPQSSTGTLAAKPFSLRGLVGQAKGVYNLTTVNGVVLSVKNSKDAKLDFTLKPLIGATAELAGTHIPGAYDVTVQMVNGSELQSAPTSTPPVATTTPATP
ncbi:MAG: hypothetical protein LiPW15_443 [Parcubacteria group bacterium LiPW_15]|nr:MAG: hypothetical protein LiPW15_443 [Parcubacteria group bacterium LiPW_15]